MSWKHGYTPRCPHCQKIYFREGFVFPVASSSPWPLSGEWFCSKKRLLVRIWKEGRGCKETPLFDCEVFIRMRAYAVSLSENRNGASQNNQNISEVKCLDNSREQLRVFVHPQKKLHPQFRESPVFSRELEKRCVSVCIVLWRETSLAIFYSLRFEFQHLKRYKRYVLFTVHKCYSVNLYWEFLPCFTLPLKQSQLPR